MCQVLFLTYRSPTCHSNLSCSLSYRCDVLGIEDTCGILRHGIDIRTAVGFATSSGSSLCGVEIESFAGDSKSGSLDAFGGRDWGEVPQLPARGTRAIEGDNEGNRFVCDTKHSEQMFEPVMRGIGIIFHHLVDQSALSNTQSLRAYELTLATARVALGPKSGFDVRTRPEYKWPESNGMSFKAKNGVELAYFVGTSKLLPLAFAANINAIHWAICQDSGEATVISDIRALA
jgi:hypothetical protein